MYQIIIEHCFFGHGKFYDATIGYADTELLAKLEIHNFLAANPNFNHHSIVIKEVNKK